MIFTLRVGGGDAVDEDDSEADDDGDDDDEQVEACGVGVNGIDIFDGGGFDHRGRSTAKGCILCRNCITSMFHLHALHGCSSRQSALHFIAGAFVGIAPGSPFRLSPAS